MNESFIRSIIEKLWSSEFGEMRKYFQFANFDAVGFYAQFPSLPVEKLQVHALVILDKLQLPQLIDLLLISLQLL